MYLNMFQSFDNHVQVSKEYIQMIIHCKEVVSLRSSILNIGNQYHKSFRNIQIDFKTSTASRTVGYNYDKVRKSKNRANSWHSLSKFGSILCIRAQDVTPQNSSQREHHEFARLLQTPVKWRETRWLSIGSLP